MSQHAKSNSIIFFQIQNQIKTWEFNFKSEFELDCKYKLQSKLKLKNLYRLFFERIDKSFDIGFTEKCVSTDVI